jgi:hypothetical protein
MRLVLLVATFAGWAVPLASQQGMLLRPGRRVWIRTPDSSGNFTAGFKGTLEAVAGDTLLVRPYNGAAAVSVSRGGQARVLISRGRRSSPVLGAAIGAGLGVALGESLRCFAKTAYELAFSPVRRPTPTAMPKLSPS